MSPAAYLDADAARLGDAELPRTVPVPVPTAWFRTAVELEHSAQVVLNVEHVVQTHIRCLEAAGALLSRPLALRVGICLSQLAAEMRMEAMRVRAGRTA